MGESEDEIKRIESDLEILTKDIPPTFHVSGFTHPKILCFTDINTPTFQLFQWGLIPNWVRDNQQALSIQNKTLNARIETIFTKPSFRASAQNKRCIIMLDAFYDYHYIKGKPIPIYIYPKNHIPLTIAGIWDTWRNNEGVAINTVSLITTKATGIMKEIHNNPKLHEQRMPYFLNSQETYKWLSKSSSCNEILNLKTDEQVNLLQAYQVFPLSGKQYKGNNPGVCARAGDTNINNL